MKNYPVNRQENGKVICGMDGALYTDLAQVTGAADRAVLAGMQDNSYNRESMVDPVAGRDAATSAAGTARTRMIFLPVFGSITGIMLLVAAFSAYDAFVWSGSRDRAPGRVVDTGEVPGDGNTVYSYPVVAFMDRDGRSHTVKMPGGSSPPEWAMGDTVTVLYDPERPADARIDSWSSTLLLWLLPAVTGIEGTGFLLAVIPVLVIMQPETR